MKLFRGVAYCWGKRYPKNSAIRSQSGRKPITLGRNLGTEVEVVKGLTASDRLVNSPPDSLSTGDIVRVVGQQSGGGGGSVGQAGNAEDVAAREGKQH
jgi:hypothetical protein